MLDVGGNQGQYAKTLRTWGFAGKIVSFEPLSEPFGILEQAASHDPRWVCRRTAVGAKPGRVALNVAANHGASSSVLPMLALHMDAAPQAQYVGTEEVPVITLDSLEGTAWEPADRLYLKVDVQGYERFVLDGAAQTIEKNVDLIELELSFAPLYDGGMLIGEAIDNLRRRGFALSEVKPGFRDVKRHLLLQADGLFVRM